METLVPTVAHILGLVGMAGIWLVPSRIWQLLVLRKIGRPLSRSRSSIVFALIVSAALALSVYIATDTLPRVFRCLWESRCTSNRAGGLLNLALFGITVLVVEVAWLISGIFLRRCAKNEA
jgi:hypothetical protein